ncbi:unnamed protein product [Acanthosepion pharaonis]|uniref:Uncharacterized protein n=1 Tax=Acanthosepion pharaonis TaxID=158019 RepID=A0A812CQ71_ACAPH|nr:unnamed protein product [Sepia pharaonis]
MLILRRITKSVIRHKLLWPLYWTKTIYLSIYLSIYLPYICYKREEHSTHFQCGDFFFISQHRRVHAVHTLLSISVRDYFPLSSLRSLLFGLSSSVLMIVLSNHFSFVIVFLLFIFIFVLSLSLYFPHPLSHSISFFFTVPLLPASVIFFFCLFVILSIASHNISTPLRSHFCFILVVHFLLILSLFLLESIFLHSFLFLLLLLLLLTFLFLSSFSSFSLLILSKFTLCNH